MRGRRRKLGLSVLLAFCLAVSIVPWTSAAGGGPGVHPLFGNLAKQDQRAPLAAVEARAPEGTAVVATGLNSPRGLAIGPDGGLYVAEGGTGGSACYQPDPGDPTFVVCVGNTGSVTRIENGQQTRIATGLPSLAGPDGFAASGPLRISWRPRDAFSIVIGLGADPAVRDALAALNPTFGDLGKLVRMNPAGRWSFMADIAGYEAIANPDGGAPDSNPYAVFSAPGRKRIIADAGGNDLLQVTNDGVISTLAVFPDRMVPYPPMFGGGEGPQQAVPTSVTQGPDGAFYVGELTGFPWPANSANVYRLVPGGQPQVFATGFNAIHDITFGPDGSLYVLQFDDDILSCELFGVCTGGKLIKVAPDGTRTVLAHNLPFPGGVVVTRSNEIYMTLYSIFPGMGMVVRM
jgi:hypothetical protein